MTDPSHMDGPDIGTGTSSWVEALKAIQPTCERFAEKLEELLKDLLEAEGIEFDHIERRVKTVSSFKEKLVRKGHKYAEPLVEMTDLTGLRIVTFYLEDMARVREMLHRAFVVDALHSVRKSEELEPDRFGYLSDHVIISLGPDRAPLPEWLDFTGLVAEIQIRTVLQHAWAAIENTLSYKRETDVPKALRRSLFRVSALLELADEQFARARRINLNLESDYAEQVVQGDLASIPLDAAALDAYFKVNDIRERWHRVGVQQGFADCDWEAAEFRDVRAQDRSDLLYALSQDGLSTVASLDVVLNEANSWGAHALKYIAESWRTRRDDDLSPSPENIITMLVLCSPQVSPALVRDIYDSDVADAIAAFKKTTGREV